MRRLLLVVEEAVMSIAMHGGDSDRLVQFELHLQPTQIVVTLQDDGPRFDPRDGHNILRLTLARE